MNQSEILFWTAILIILVLTLMLVLLLAWADRSMTKREAQNESFITREMKRLEGKGKSK